MKTEESKPKKKKKANRIEHFENDVHENKYNNSKKKIISAEKVMMNEYEKRYKTRRKCMEEQTNYREN